MNYTEKWVTNNQILSSQQSFYFISDNLIHATQFNVLKKLDPVLFCGWHFDLLSFVRLDNEVSCLQFSSKNKINIHKNLK